MADDDVIERRLLGERAAALRRLEALRGDHAAIVDASLQSNADDEHDPEGATIAFERAQVQALLDQAQRRVEEADAALGLLKEGEYGVCSVCGRVIPEGRLEARPTAATCVTCSAAGGDGVRPKS